MKLFIDDTREPPNGWVLARTSREAINHFLHSDITHISFDHDMGNDLNGLEIAKVFTSLLRVCHKDWPIEYHVHSSNPAGAKNIQAELEYCLNVNVDVYPYELKYGYIGQKDQDGNVTLPM